MTGRITIALVVALAWCSTVAQLSAEEPYLAFLAELRQRGYGDMSVAYLQQLSTRSDLPPAIREVLDLELSTSYRVWTQQTQNAEVAQQRLAESQALFDKFVAAHPQHAAVPATLLEWGDPAFQRGQRILARALNLQDAGLRAKYLDDARSAFGEAKRCFEQAATRFKQQLATLTITTALPASKPTSAAAGEQAEQTRRQAELGWVESKLKLAGVDFYLAQTYLDPKAPERMTALQTASQGFDWLYERFPGTEVGLRAQLWRAKVVEELGKPAEALERYDELLAVEPEGTDCPPDVATFYAQAGLWRVQLMIKQNGLEVGGAEANEWLSKHKSWRSTAGYQGIALEAAKAALSQAEKGPASRKAKLMQEAMTLLAGISNVPSEYRDEAIMLRRQHLEPSLQAGRIPFDGHMAVGEAAAEAGKWSDAISAYSAAAEIAQKDGKSESAKVALHRANHARYRLAVMHFTAGEMEEAIQMAGLVAKSGTDDPSAPAAASLALFSALAVYESSRDDAKAAALSRVEKITDFAIHTWPGQPAGDDAQIVRGQLCAARGEAQEALQYFDHVDQASPRYSAAAIAAGRVYWKLYLDEKHKGEDIRKDDLLRQFHSAAVEKLQSAVLSSSKSATDPDSPRQGLESRALLAEVYLESEQPKKALEIIKAIIPECERTGPQKELGNLKVRVLLSGLRGYSATGQVERAGELAAKIGQAGPDSAYVNAVLVEFAHLLRKEFESARTKWKIQNTQGALEQIAVSDGQARMTELRERLNRLMPVLTPRKQFTVQAMAFLADTCVELERDEPARDFCERALRRAEEDPESATRAERQLTKVRFQLANLLCKQNQFADAANQVDKLLLARPNVLELLMQKGKVLQAWAKSDATRYDPCIAHWTNVRMKLGSLQPKPPEYYEVVYNAAFCLVEQSNAARNATKARHAEQLLKSTLALNPNLNGPEMVQRFNALLKQLQPEPSDNK